MSQNPRLWISYAWVDDEQGDFRFLVQKLKDVGVDVYFDKRTIVAGQHLWDQIADQITNGQYAGWAYLLTPASIARKACREELAYALDRALKSPGPSFPLVGLLHNVDFDIVPPALRVRKCISLSSQTWPNEVRDALENRATDVQPEPVSTYAWTVRQGHGSNPNATVIEVRPRFTDLAPWRFAVPAGTPVEAWGLDPGGGKVIMPASRMVHIGRGFVHNGVLVDEFGSGDTLSPSVSASLVFPGIPPPFVRFGTPSELYGPIADYEECTLARL